MFHGELVAIYITATPGTPMESAAEITADPGMGLRGDRHSAGLRPAHKGGPKPDQEITLIEAEAIEGVVRDYKLDLSAQQTRRNLLTRGVPLNHLVGQTFRVGDVLLRGVELCEPCGHLERLTFAGIKKALLHRGGLRAQIIRGGTIRPGDAIGPAEEMA
mgnify:CR=1 FL=1